MKIIIGDLNAKIRTEEMFRPTYYQQKDIYKGTWRSPDGKTINQIDHVLIEKDLKECITHVRTYRGADIDSDHFLVGVKMRQLIPEKRNRQKNKKPNN